MSNYDMSYLCVMVDMAGCPNRCRHCWLGAHKNGHMSVEDFREIALQFKGWRDKDGNGMREWGFSSWWREPDYHKDYRILWEEEKALSSPGRAERFELLSSWRLARDESYAPWAAQIGTEVCQLTFFGMEASTDWGMRRRGAFRDQIAAAERCIEAGIAPRWQLFLTKRCLPELDEFMYLMRELDLWRRCEKLGRRFEFFIGGISPEGCGYELEEERLEKSDLELIPRELAALSRNGTDLLGSTENELLPELLQNNMPPEISAGVPAIAVDADYDVYPNIAEPAIWWRAGNLKTDGVDQVMTNLLSGVSPGMTANKTIPLSDLAGRYGFPGSQKLYTRGDLIRRFMHQWGIDSIKHRPAGLPGQK